MNWIKFFESISQSLTIFTWSFSIIACGYIIAEFIEKDDDKKKRYDTLSFRYLLTTIIIVNINAAIVAGLSK